MAKIYPNDHTLSSSSSSAHIYLTTTRETFTVWMKSLVFHGSGCSVFNSKGQLVYRMDNYDKKSGSEVYLMDLRGNVLFSLQKRRLGLSKHWDGYKWHGSRYTKPDRSWFQVRKSSTVFNREIAYDVTITNDKAKSYKIVGLAGQLGFQIRDKQDKLVAEVKQKHLSSGYGLGEDVLSLVVEPHVDSSLVMGLVSVYGLMRKNI